MKSKILLIVEGEKEELRILGNASHGLLSLIGGDYEIVPFASSIYELYDAYINGEYDDLVSYLRYEKKLDIDKNILSKDAFSSIYLVFDFDPQYQKYSDDKIRELLNLFNNETELGKLYINYPMVESFYHLLKLPDKEYDNRMIDLTNLNSKVYKKEVNANTCIKKNNISQKELCYIIMQNYNKALLITEYYSTNINHSLILEKEINFKNKKNELYVLSTFPFIVLDYNYDKTINILKDKLKRDFILYKNN